jgi:hypothetical protein
MGAVAMRLLWGCRLPVGDMAGGQPALPRNFLPRMDTVCKPESEHQQNSKNHCKIKGDSPSLARIVRYFSALALANSLAVGCPFGFANVRIE